MEKEEMTVEKYFLGYWSDEVLDLARDPNREEILKVIIEEAKEDKIILSSYDVNEYLQDFLEATEEANFQE